ncbi:MAG: PIN domain-containing protein [Candidatus Methanoperedens sp.]|nr:PIN domain-containing protein [Candidatus Methanoperedens sp.]HLB69979.1 PIN domain-containing protein [Candidatus Methanoperedens sp.]
MVDTNLLIAAIKKYTRSTDLLVYLLTNPEIELIANDVLLGEYSKFALKLGALEFFELINSVVAVVNPSKECVMNCKQYFPKNEMADAVHAATCLQYDAVLISNDKHYDKIRNMKIIEVWKISEAIKKLPEA